MSDPTLRFMLLSALSTAVFHTLVPDHWIPFVLIGRARGWSARATALVSGGSALVHVALSIALAAATLAVGREAAERLGHGLETASGVLLVAFGTAYALWAYRKGGHFHPGGALLHGTAEPDACEGSEGPRHPEHLHWHADRAWIGGAGSRGAAALALIVGLNPCVLLLPLLLAVAERGAGAVALVTLAYAVPTVLLMVGLSVVGVATTRRLPVPGFARHMEAASGVVIALTGVVFLVLGHG